MIVLDLDCITDWCVVGSRAGTPLSLGDGGQVQKWASWPRNPADLIMFSKLSCVQCRKRGRLHDALDFSLDKARAVNLACGYCRDLGNVSARIGGTDCIFSLQRHSPKVSFQQSYCFVRQLLRPGFVHHLSHNSDSSVCCTKQVSRVPSV